MTGCVYERNKRTKDDDPGLSNIVLVTDTRAGLPVRTEKKKTDQSFAYFFMSGVGFTLALCNWSIVAFSLLDVAETKKERIFGNVLVGIYLCKQVMKLTCDTK